RGGPVGAEACASLIGRLLRPAKKTLPEPSTAGPSGSFSPEATRVETVRVEAFHSLSVLSPMLVKKTLPAPSTATPSGRLCPATRVETVWVEAFHSSIAPLKVAAIKTLPAPSTATPAA